MAKKVNNSTEEFLLKKIKGLEKRIEEKELKEKLIIKTIEKGLQKLPKLDLPKNIADFKDKFEEEMAVIHLSDSQIGKETDSYNTDIAERRILEFGKKTVEEIKRRQKHSKISKALIIIGGDMVEGEKMRNDQAFEIDSSVFDQSIKRGSAMVVKFVLLILEVIEKIKIVSVPGNHGRNGKRGDSGSHDTNWDNVLSAAARFILVGSKEFPRKDTENRIEFLETNNWYTVQDVLGNKLLITHGDAIGAGGAHPWGNIAKQAVNWADSIPEDWRYLYVGHFHTFSQIVINKRIILINGTTESGSDFVVQQLGISGFPSQRVSFYNQKDGLIMDRQIFLE